MSLPILTLIVLAAMPIVLSWVSGYYRHEQLGGVDNKLPRKQNEALEGAGARAVAAQKNAWEGLAVYMAALLAVSIAEVPVEKYASLTLVIMLCRVLHGIFYVINQDILRSIAFLGSYGVCIYMMVLAI